MEHIHLIKDSIVNSHAWKGKMDLFNIVMIGLAEELPEHEKKSMKLTAIVSNRQPFKGKMFPGNPESPIVTSIPSSGT